MSQISIKPFKLSENNLSIVELHINEQNKYDAIEIKFICSYNIISVLSASLGTIMNGSIIKISAPKINYLIAYVYLGACLNAECMIGYFFAKKMVSSETLNISTNKRELISSNKTSLMPLEVKGTQFQEKYDVFLKSLKMNKSKWQTTLSIKDDVYINFNATEQHTSLFSIGEMTDELLCSDYIFSADAQTQYLHFPIGIFKKNQQLYKTDKVAMFELINPSFINSDVLYYKSLVSNYLLLADILNA